MRTYGDGGPTMSTGDADADLLARIAGGDHDALRDLFTAYRPRLRRHLWHVLGGDAAAVEDALQETFVAVWRGAAQFRGQARAATWLFQIAHFQAAHALRARSRHLTAALPDDADTAQALTAPADDRAILDRLSLADAMAQLSPAHRAALDLVFVQGFSVAEAAAILNVPAGTAKSRLSYARRALARALADADETEARP